MDGEFDRVAGLVRRTRECSRRLHPDLVTDWMDELFEAAERAGAIGSKACGAGGGGCLVFICAGGRRGDVERALSERGAELIPFEFEPRSRIG